MFYFVYYYSLNSLLNLKPLSTPGSIEINVKADILRSIYGRLPTTVNVIRIIAGLALPVRCYNSIGTGSSVGSCSYNDLCKDFLQDIYGVNESNCIPELLDWGIDCSCPFNLPAQSVEGSHIFDIPKLMNIPEHWFGSGDFDVTFTVNSASNQHIACIRFKYTISF